MRVKARKCPKCGCYPYAIVDYYVGHIVEWDVEDDGGIELDGGILNPGHNDHVYAVCECGHEWRLRNIISANDLEEIPDKGGVE